MKEMWTSLASVIGVVAFLQATLHALLPAELRVAFLRLLHRVLRRLFPPSSSRYCYFDVTETDGVSTNELYHAVQLYLSSSLDPSPPRLSLSRSPNSSSFTFSLPSSASSLRLHDTFMGAPCTWDHVVSPRHHPQPTAFFSLRPLPEERRGFTLRLRRRDRATVLRPYLDHITEEAAAIRRRGQDRLLYTNAARGVGGASPLDPRGGGSHPWEAVPFKHPSTFDTLAMDPARKAEIMADLRGFAEGGAFYKRTGRAWKRGYLLHGPPGTGKSSMIAAMANYLGYDVYDLELTEVHTNSELRKLLMKTTSKSIIVIEDIDCTLNLTNRMKKVVDGEEGGGQRPNNKSTMTLSGLLGFTDGLWSCCGSERIFVFTTNHVGRIDPALLRSGRMDMHVHMGYCTPPALRLLLRNYLGWEDGEGGEEEEVEVEGEMEKVLQAAEITPADVSEVLIRNRAKGRREAIGKLLEVLKGRVERKKGAVGSVGGGERREGEVEEEEQEKRALESPKEGGGWRGVEEEFGEDGKLGAGEEREG